MKHLYKSLLSVFFLVTAFACAQSKFEPVQVYSTSGRVEKMGKTNYMLIGPASSVSFNFEGTKCAITLKSVDSHDHHNYVSLELDGEYAGRLKVEKGASKAYTVPVSNKNKRHTLTIYKATEAANGGVLFESVSADLKEAHPVQKKKIEFIGNSITCGMGNDTKEIPCGNGEWYDQHNAYWAYGPIVSRKLNAAFLLSSVSGIGMYRNWNDEHKDEAIMPDVYANLYLNKDASKPYDFAFQPDIISIALGTNDFSNGDGKNERLPFNPDKFIGNYIEFIKMLYKHNPNAQLVLVNSPMVSGEKDKLFNTCLNTIKDAFKKDAHKPILIFNFKEVTPHGCTSHPDIDDHKLMAEQYFPFLEKLLK